MDIRLECVNSSCRNLCVPEFLVECPVCETLLMDVGLAVHVCAQHENIFYPMPFAHKNAYKDNGKPTTELNYQSVIYALSFAELTKNISNSCLELEKDRFGQYMDRILDLFFGEFQGDFLRSSIWLPQWFYVASLNHFPNTENSGSDSAARLLSMAKAISIYMIWAASTSGYRVSEQEQIDWKNCTVLEGKYVDLAMSEKLKGLSSISLLRDNPVIEHCLSMFSYRDESKNDLFEVYKAP